MYVSGNAMVSSFSWMAASRDAMRCYDFVFFVDRFIEGCIDAFEGVYVSKALCDFVVSISYGFVVFAQIQCSVPTHNLCQ